MQGYTSQVAKRVQLNKNESVPQHRAELSVQQLRVMQLLDIAKSMQGHSSGWHDYDDAA